MGNILTDSSAPYVIVVAIGAIGWLVATGIDDIKKINLTEYTMQKTQNNNESYINIDIHNRSMSKTVSSGFFTFRCSGVADASCFFSGDPVVVATPLRGVAHQSKIEGAGHVYRASAQLAPQSSIRYTVRTASPDNDILLLYEIPQGDKTEENNIVFKEGNSLEGWIADNYLETLIYTLFSLIGLLFIWILSSAVAILISYFGLFTSRQKETIIEPASSELERGTTDA